MVSRNKNGGSAGASRGSGDNLKGKGKINTIAKSSTKNAPSTVQTLNVTLEPNRVNETDCDNNLDGLDLELESICEVVISLKCKQCGFICNDNTTLSRHIKQTHFKLQLNNVIKDKEKDCNTTNRKHSQKGSSSSASIERGRDGIGVSEPEQANVPRSSNSSRTERRKELEKQMKIPQEKVDLNEDLFSDNDNEDDNSRESYEDVFLCAECDIVFSSREACCGHMSVVHGLEQFNAEFLEDEIPDSSDEGEKVCETRKTKLPKQFTPEAGTIVSKRFRVRKGPVHACRKCSIKFDNVEVLKFHEKCHTHGFEKSVLAILCDSSSDQSQDVPEKKPNTHSGNDSKMKEIEKSGSIKVEALRYPKTFFCPVCETNRKYRITFPKWAMCAWHLWKEHRIDCELYTCTICKQFKSYYIARVKDHEQLHSDNAIYKCKICNKSFKQLKQLRCHEKYHKEFKTKLAPQMDSRWYTPKECPICKRILSDSKCLKKHISAVHNKLKPFVCNICGHTSARKQELRLHIRQHTGEKPYKCTICDFQTGDHNSLRKHKLRHGDKRPYSCPYCDYRCIQSCAFKKHILAMHPGQDVVFLCQLCSHASVNETLFAAHQREHDEAGDGEEPPPSTKVSSTAPSPESDLEDSYSRHLSGDDESLDIVDNGGVTIPASPASPAPSTSAAAFSKPIEKKKSSSTTSSTSVSTTPLSSTITTSQTPEILFEKPNINGGPFTLLNSFVVLKETNHSGESVLILEPCSNKSSSTIETTSKMQPENRGKSPSTSAHSSSKFIPLPTNCSNGPFSGTGEYLKNPTQDIRGSEDNESSSEVIFNPHQLIQNVQLTPLDLTGVFEQQSNDEGMLQRLLDMSGV